MSVLLIGPVTRELNGYNSGGVAMCVTNAFVELKQRGLNVGLIRTGRSFNIEGFKVLLFIKYFFLFLQQLKNIRSFRRLIKEIINLFRFSTINPSDFKIIHIHGVDNCPYFFVELINRKSLNIVLTVHSYHAEKKYIPYNQNLFDFCRAVIHVSNTDLSVAKELGYKFKKSIVVHNFVSHVKMLSQREFIKKEGACFVGSDIPRKRLPLAISIAKRMELSLKVIGRVSKSHDKEVSYLGVLDHNLVYRELRASTILINPSTSESFGLVYIEALLNGCIVIGYKDVLDEFLDYVPDLPALACDSDDMSEIERKIRSEIENYSYQEYRKVFSLLHPLFSAKTHFNKLLKLYQSILTG